MHNPFLLNIEVEQLNEIFFSLIREGFTCDEIKKMTFTYPLFFYSKQSFFILNNIKIFIHIISKILFYFFKDLNQNLNFYDLLRIMIIINLLNNNKRSLQNKFRRIQKNGTDSRRSQTNLCPKSLYSQSQLQKYALS